MNFEFSTVYDQKVNYDNSAMISGLILLLTWLIFTSIIARHSVLPQRIIPAISFVASQVFLFFFYFSLTFLGASLISKSFLLIYTFSCLTLLFLKPNIFYSWLNQLRNFLCLNRDCSLSKNCNFSQNDYIARLKSIRSRLTVFIISALLLSSSLMASPKSWDAYIYNLSRLPHMILEGTPLLTNSPSLPQAIFPLGHDLLYYPDIRFGSLQGMGIINTLEFILIIGISFNICELLFAEDKSSDVALSCMLETAKLISLCLHISSDQQVLQANSVKNDLIITLLFALACLNGLSYLKNNYDYKLSDLSISSIFLTLYGYVCKGYGLITIFPFLIIFPFKLLTEPSFRQLFLCSLSSLHQRAKPFGTAQMVLLLLTTCLLLFTLFFNWFVSSFYSILPGYESSLLSLINNYSSALDYIKSGVLNFTRYLLIFIAYPYSTLLKESPSGENDFVLGLSPIVKILASDNFAVSEGYTFGLIRNMNEDVSIVSPFVHLIFILTLLTSIYCLIFISQLGSYNQKFCKVLDISKIGYLTVSLSLSAFSFFAILAYHNWYVKYLGFVYICLIPVLACILSFNLFVIIRFFNIPFATMLDHPLIIFFRALPIASSLFLFLFLLSTDVRFYLSPSSHQKAIPYQLYDEYLHSTGYFNEDKKRDFIKQFAAEGPSELSLCFGENTPTLGPLIELLKNNSSKKTIRFLPLNHSDCKPNKNLGLTTSIVLP